SFKIDLKQQTKKDVLHSFVKLKSNYPSTGSV
ncbi:MAG: hypothetical protein ACI857_001829, partial [Arenicella sp.]